MLVRCICYKQASRAVGCLVHAIHYKLAGDILALIGLGSVGGRTLGSMVRWGPVMHTARAPGMLTVMDGFVVAAGAYFAAMLLFVS